MQHVCQGFSLAFIQVYSRDRVSQCVIFGKSKVCKYEQLFICSWMLIKCQGSLSEPLKLLCCWMGIPVIRFSRTSLWLESLTNRAFGLAKLPSPRYKPRSCEWSGLLGHAVAPQKLQPDNPYGIARQDLRTGQNVRSGATIRKEANAQIEVKEWRQKALQSYCLR